MSNISTDEITPGWVCFYYDETLGQYVYVGMREGAVQKDEVKNGGFAVVVSGLSKGCGSSRETAPYAEKAAGIQLVIAQEHRKDLRPELAEHRPADVDRLRPDRTHPPRRRDPARRVHQRPRSDLAGHRHSRRTLQLQQGASRGQSFAAAARNGAAADDDRGKDHRASRVCDGRQDRRCRQLSPATRCLRGRRAFLARVRDADGGVAVQTGVGPGRARFRAGVGVCVSRSPDVPRPRDVAQASRDGPAWKRPTARDHAGEFHDATEDQALRRESRRRFGSDLSQRGGRGSRAARTDRDRHRLAHVHGRRARLFRFRCRLNRHGERVVHERHSHSRARDRALRSERQEARGRRRERRDARTSSQPNT